MEEFVNELEQKTERCEGPVLPDLLDDRLMLSWNYFHADYMHWPMDDDLSSFCKKGTIVERQG